MSNYCVRVTWHQILLKLDFISLWTKGLQIKMCFQPPWHVQYDLSMHNYNWCHRSCKVNINRNQQEFHPRFHRPAVRWYLLSPCNPHQIVERLCSFPSPPHFNKPCDIWDTDRPFCYTRLKEASLSLKFLNFALFCSCHMQSSFSSKIEIACRMVIHLGMETRTGDIVRWFHEMHFLSLEVETQFCKH